ncbi:uncharacterized protein [Ptychodera flava]|uniref:uncharacterized protein n=1 Tax=Ptychodera flava TaxID=63121 RepID=UPI003969BB68
MLLSTLFCVFLAGIGSINAESCEDMSETFSGRARSFDAVSRAESGREACNFVIGGEMVAGVSTTMYQGAKVCGECLEVTGANGETVLVTVIGKCSACDDNGLKLSEDAYNRLKGDVSSGPIDVTWKVVPCQVRGNIRYKFKDRSSERNFGLQVYNHRYPIDSIEVRSRGDTDWIQTERNGANFFIKKGSSGLMAFPIEVQVTSTTGVKLQHTIREITVDTFVRGSSQFPACGEEVEEQEEVEEHEDVEEENEELDDEPQTEDTDEESPEQTSSGQTSSGRSGCKRPGTGRRRHHGDGTFYRGAPEAAAGKGNCMIDNQGDIMIGAMNKPSWEKSEVCGECVEITGPEGDVVMVKIVDSCPECHEGDIDLSKEAFDLIAGDRQGRIEIFWRVVECPVHGTLSLRFKDGSSKYWFALQVLNHRYKVKSLSVQRAEGGKWIKLERTDYNFFVRPDGAGKVEAPFTLRIESVTGQKLYSTITQILRSQAIVFRSNLQFDSCEEDMDNSSK